MNSFLNATACDGRKPRHLEGSLHHSRPAILKELLYRRDAVRFLVAPTCFGKTAAALEYAERIFGFEGVFWVNAQSPCFIRDLDKGTIASSLIAQGARASLAVFEDVSPLAEERIKALNECFDELLEHGWEVLVTTVPAAESIYESQPDCIRVLSRQMLLSEDEVKGVSARVAEGEISHAAAKIPGVAWGGEKAMAKLLEGAIGDWLPGDVLLAMFIMLMMEKGDLDELTRFMGSIKSDSLTCLEQDYVFTGVDCCREVFAAVKVPVEDLAEAFKALLPRLVQSSLFPDGDTFVLHLADALVAHGRHERACAVVLHLCSATKRLQWLEAQGAEMLDAACFLPAAQVFESKSLKPGAHASALMAQQAWRLCALGDRETASEFAHQALASRASSDAVHVSAASLLACFGEGGYRERGAAYMDSLGKTAFPKGKRELSEEGLRAMMGSADTWKAVVWAWSGIRGGLEGTLETIGALASLREPDPIVSAVLTYALREVGERYVHVDEDRHSLEARVLHPVGSYLERCNSMMRCTISDSELLLRWDRLHAAESKRPALFAHSWLNDRAGAIQASLLSQRRAYKRNKKGAHAPCLPKGGNATVRSERVESPADPGSVTVAIPTLHIRLFGGLEMSIGGKRIAPESMRRQKVKTLLAILALNQGKEILRDRLAALLWPDSPSDTARHNFYSTWSLLKTGLSLPDGTCPYLVRLQHSCKLESEFVTSDVAEFDSLCNRLLFNEYGSEAWGPLYARLDEVYGGELLPSERDNHIIVQAREEYLSRLVDALVSAASYFYENNELRTALWFARAAAARDPLREDAYAMLMRVQIAHGQRTAALDTFFKCRHHLSENLGIDPSKQTIDLYRDIIGDDSQEGQC